MRIKLTKLAAEVLAASLVFALAIDWCCPGEGLHFAVNALGLNGACNARLFPLWSWIVRLTGGDFVSLSRISAGAAVACVLLIGSIFGDLVRLAVRRGTEVVGGREDDFRPVEYAVVPLVIAAFVLTPGFLYAATRVSPLLTVLIPPLAALAVAVRVLTERALQPKVSRSTEADAAPSRVAWAIRPLVLVALLAVIYSVFEVFLARRTLVDLTLVPLGTWLAIGAMPSLVVTWCARKRWLVRRKVQRWTLGAWGAAVLVLGVCTFMSGTLDRGRVANRIVGQIVANAKGRAAVVSEGALDDILLYMLPEGQRMITLSRDRDPSYGRELGEWVRQEVKVKGEGEQRNVEDLVFAAELGPRALIGEWAKLDEKGFEATVVTAPFYFPTREAWEAAVAELAGMRGDEPLGNYLRWMLGWCGNALGCRMIEEGKREEGKGKREEKMQEAWDVFWKISDTVDPSNYAALINLFGMSQRGKEGVKEKMETVRLKMREIEGRLKTWEAIRWAAQAGGRLYIDPEERIRFEKARRETLAKREPTAEQRRFVETIAAAPQGPDQGKAAREAIRSAVGAGKVRADLVGEQLIVIDLALGDRVGAERDSIDVLRVDRHHAMANATIGMLRGMAGDFEQSERYLRRAVASDKAKPAAKNDLAFTLMQMGRFDEAESFAREAVKAVADSWQFRETLAAILIRKGGTEEGERELAKAEELAEKGGFKKELIPEFALDRAWLFKKRDDENHLKIALRALKSRTDLSDTQKAEAERIERGW